MKTCGICQSENPADANLCATCGSPLTELAAEAEIQMMMHSEAARKKKNRMIMASVAAAVVLVGAYKVVAGQRAKQRQEAARSFYTSWLEVDNKHVPEFWKCLTRARNPKTNIELANSVGKAFDRGPAGYVEHARSKCLQKILEAPAAMRELQAPEDMQPAVDNYAVALEKVGKAGEGLIESLAEMAKQAEGDKKVVDMANTYHYSDDDSPQTYAYDNFLRCSFPSLDSMKEMQEILVKLHEAMKEESGTMIARIRKECQPDLAKEGAIPHKNYPSNVKKLSTDPRDVQAWEDVFKRSSMQQRRTSLEPIERAWFEFMQSRGQLQDAIKAFLGEAWE